MQSNSASTSVEPVDETNASPVLTCVSCGGDNVAGSKFCRHCGEVLTAGGASASTAVASSAVASSAAVASPGELSGNGAALPANGSSPDGQSLHDAFSPSNGTDAHSSTYEQRLMRTRPNIPPPEDEEMVDRSREIDQRRARQLLDRAFALAERGDMPAAILACRQSVTLAPNSAPGFSMLGLLLERSGDYEHAIDAYKEVLRLVPDSRLERDSILRLQAALGQQSRHGSFHFDDKELFDNVGVAPEPPPSSGTVSTAKVESPAKSDGAVDSIVTPPAATTAASAAAAMAPAVAALAPVHNVDTAPAPANGISVAFPRIGSAGAGTAAFNPQAATASPAIAAIDFGPVSSNTSVLQKLSRNPSFYFQGTPLMAATAAGLLFMVFARNYASVRLPVPTPQQTEINTTNPTQQTSIPQPEPSPATAVNPATTTTTSGTAAAVPGATPNATNDSGGVTIDVRNRPRRATPTPGSPNAATSTGAGANRALTPSSRPVPSFPAPSVNNDIPRGLPPATIVLPSARQAPVIALPDEGTPADTGGISRGGTPLNPAGSPTRGYIRISPPSPMPQSAPSRPSYQGAAAERAAAAAARAGRTGSSLNSITSAIESGGGDTAWRYQQRALLFLERGDNARAADDFQTAISAYRDQISRNVNVAGAQNGINACRSGLNLALANMR